VEPSADVEAEAERVGDTSPQPAQILAEGDAEGSPLAEPEGADTSNAIADEEIGWVAPETAVAASLDVVATETAALVEPFEPGADEPALETAASLDVVEAEPAATPRPDQVVVPSMFARLRAFAQSMGQRGKAAEPPVDAPEAMTEPVLESDAPAEPLPREGASLAADVPSTRATAPQGFELPAPLVTTAPAAPVPDAAAIESAAAAARALLEAALLRVQSARQRQELIEPELRGEAAPSPSLALGAGMGQPDAERRVPAAAGSGASLLESVPLAAFVPRTGVQSPEDIANAAAAARALLETALDAASMRPVPALSPPPTHVGSAIIGAEAAQSGWGTPSGHGWAPSMAAEAAPAAQSTDWSPVVAAAPPPTAALSQDREVPAAHPAAANIGTAAIAAAVFAENATAPVAASPPPMPAFYGAAHQPLQSVVPSATPVLSAQPPAIQTSFPAQPPVPITPIPFVPAPPAAVSWVGADDLAQGRDANAPHNDGDFPGEAGERLAPPLDTPMAAPNMAAPSGVLSVMPHGAEPRTLSTLGAANEIAPPPLDDVREPSQPLGLDERLAPLASPAAIEFAPSPFFPPNVPSAPDDIREALLPEEVDERFAPPIVPAPTGSVSPPSFGQGVAHGIDDVGVPSLPIKMDEHFAPSPPSVPVAAESVVPPLFARGVPNALDDIGEVPPPVDADERFAPPIAAESIAPAPFGQGIPNALDDIREVPAPADADERFAPLPSPAPVAAETVAPPPFGQGVPNALDDICEFPPPADADERFAPLPSPSPVAAESVATPFFGQSVPNALDDIREVPTPADADERFTSLPPPEPVAAETVAPPPFGQSVPNALDDIREEPLVPEADERSAPAPLSPAAETAAPSFRPTVPNALDDIREVPLPAEAETVAFPSFPQRVPNALDDIREPSLEETGEAAEPAPFVPLRSPLLSALDDIREPGPDPHFASADNVIAAEAEFARRNAFDVAEEAGEPSPDGEEGGAALGEAIESVLASKWYGNGEAPGAPAAAQRAPSPAPPVVRQITHDSLLAELRSAREADAPPPEPQPKQSSNRMLVIVCVVIGLVAAAGGVAVMTGVGGFFGVVTSHTAPRR
jgi:hypothetical protein